MEDTYKAICRYVDGHDGGLQSEKLWQMLAEQPELYKVLKVELALRRLAKQAREE